MADVGVKLKVDGEKEFREAIKECNAVYKDLNSEMKLAKAEFDNAGDKQKYLSDQAGILTSMIKNQEEKVVSALSFSCRGYLANPELTLTGQDTGTVYGKMRMQRTIGQNQVLYLSSRYGETDMTVDGEDALAYVDLSYDPWLRVPNTEQCSLVLSSDDDMNVSVELLMYDYYRTV